MRCSTPITPESLHGSPTCQVRFVHEAEGTSESEFPAKAGPISLVTFGTEGGFRLMSPGRRLSRREGDRRQDLHQRPSSAECVQGARRLLLRAFAGWPRKSASTAEPHRIARRGAVETSA